MTLLFAAMAMVLLLSSGVALAAHVKGNNADNTLKGTNHPDSIYAFAGDDLVYALMGADRLYGGYGADNLYGNRGGDHIFGGRGTDHLYGGYGDDHIVSQDLDSSGIGMRDVVDCGPGHDTFAADFEDRVLDNCEEGSEGGA